MKKFIWLLIAIILVVAVALRITKAKKSEKPVAKSYVEIQREQGIAVETSVVNRGDLKQTRVFSGTIEGFEQTDISAKIPERIDVITVKVGNQVKTSQLLVKLDKTGPSSQYIQAESAYLNAKKNYERLQNLFKDKAISEQMLDQAKTGFDISKANFDATIKLVELRSPIAGIVTDIAVIPGEQAVPGRPLLTVAKVERVKLVFDIGEADTKDIKFGQEAEVVSKIDQTIRARGLVSEVARSADPKSRSFQIKVTVDNRGGYFKPGMFASAEIRTALKRAVLAINRDATFLEDGKRMVFVINGNIAQKREITTGMQTDNTVEVLSGLQEGETIVTLGQHNLSDGSKVNITK